MKNFVIVAVLTAFLGACAGLQPHQENLMRTGVTYATLKIIKDGERAERVHRVASRAAELVQDDLVTTVAEIERVVRDEIDFSKLSIEDAMLVDVLIATIRIELERILEGKEIGSDEHRVAVATVLRWVAQAAAMRM